MLVGAIVGFVTQRYPPDPKQAGVLGLLFIAAVGVGAVDAHMFTTSQPSGDVLQDITPLVGTWKGTSEGQPGSGTVERTYERALGNRFIRVRNRSVYPAQAKNPKGETHEDEGFFSFDRARKLIVLRQFHVEGFVNEYVQQPTSSNPLVFVTESIENIPQGWRARETYIFSGDDEVEEVFELAAPGKPFELYSRARLRRARQ
jgi:THAP4-like, heme-binding beta-barrel domain